MSCVQKKLLLYDSPSPFPAISSEILTYPPRSSSLTMVPVCVKPVSPETMLPAPSFPQSSDALDTRASWC